MSKLVFNIVMLLCLLFFQGINSSFAEQDLSSGIDELNEVTRENDGQTAEDYKNMYGKAWREYNEHNSVAPVEHSKPQKTTIEPKITVEKHNNVPCFVLEKEKDLHKFIRCSNGDYKVIKPIDHGDYWIIEGGSLLFLQGKWKVFDEAAMAACKCDKR